MSEKVLNQPILTYTIASKDIYREGEEYRAIYLRIDPWGGFTLFGVIPDKAEILEENFTQVILEYALAWNFPGKSPQAILKMREFGIEIGEVIANQVKLSYSQENSLHAVSYGLEGFLRSIGAKFAVENMVDRLRYDITGCPLCIVAGQTGVPQEVDLSHAVITAVYESLVHSIDPGLEISLPAGPYNTHIICVRLPVEKHLEGLNPGDSVKREMRSQNEEFFDMPAYTLSSGG